MNYQNGVYTPSVPNFNVNNPYNPTNQPLYYSQNMAPQQMNVQPQQNVQGQMQNAAQPQQSPQMYAAVPPQTNKIFVTSIDDALNRTAPYNSEIMYYHQDQPFSFEVRTDGQGKKDVIPIKMIPYTREEMEKEIRGVAKADLDKYATKKDLADALESINNSIASFKNNIIGLISNNNGVVATNTTTAKPESNPTV